MLILRRIEARVRSAASSTPGVLLLPALLSCVVASSPLCAQSAADYQQQAVSLLEQQRQLEALAILEQGLARFPDAPELLLQRGALLLRLGRLEEGEAQLDAALRLVPEDPRILRKSAESRLRQGRLQEAIELFRRSMTRHGPDAESHFQLAYTLFLRGSTGEALEEARAAVTANAVQPDYRRFLAFLLSLAGEAGEAYRQLLTAHRLDPDDPQTLYRLAALEKGRGHLGQALEFAELARELDPENPLYQQLLADLFEEAGEAESSRHWRRRAASLERAFLVYSRALGLARQDRVREATLLLEEVTTENPEFVSGLSMLAQLYQRQGLDDQALAAYLEVLRRNPSEPQAEEETAWIRFRQGSLEEALRTLGERPDQHLGTGLLRAHHLMREKRWARALELLELLREKNPLSADLMQWASFCLSELGRHGEALELLALASGLEPEDGEIDRLRRRLRFEQALQLEEGGRWRGAARLLEELVALDPANADYRFHLGYCRQQLGELGRAVTHYRLGLLAEPGAAWARQNLAACLYRTGQYAEAAEQFQRLAAAGETPETLFQLGLCYSHLGRDPEAELAFEKAMRHDPTPEVLYNLGITRLRLARPADAWSLLRESARRGYPPAARLLARRAGR